MRRAYSVPKYGKSIDFTPALRGQITILSSKTCRPRKTGDAAYGCINSKSQCRVAALTPLPRDCKLSLEKK